MFDPSISWPRWWLRVGLAGFGILVLAGSVLLGLRVLAFSITIGGPGSTLPQQYSKLTPGMTRTSAHRSLGEPADEQLWFPTPTPDYPDQDLVTPPAGSSCEYWSEANAIQDIEVMRVCYLADRVVQRASYDVEGAHIIVVWSGAPWAAYTVVPQ